MLKTQNDTFGNKVIKLVHSPVRETSADALQLSSELVKGNPKINIRATILNGQWDQIQKMMQTVSDVVR